MSTKEQLQADNERLGREVAALRDLLTAVGEAMLPRPAGHADHDRRLERAAIMLSCVTVSAGSAMDYAASAAFPDVLHAQAAGIRREIAGPLGYTPKGAEPEPTCKCGHAEAWHAGAVLLDPHPGQCRWNDDCDCQRYRTAAPAQASPAVSA